MDRTAEIFNRLKKERGLTNAQLAERCGMAQSTIDKLSAGANTNPKLDTLLALCRELDCPLSAFDDGPGRTEAPALSAEALKLARDYEALDRHGRRTVMAVMNEEKARMAPAEVPAPRSKVIPLFGARFAAGPAEPDFGNAYEDYTVPAECPADFAIHIKGRSMEPRFPDGSIALGKRAMPKDGEVGAFCLNGLNLCKQLQRDDFGNVYLIGLNRACAEDDRAVFASGNDNLSCYGVIYGTAGEKNG